MLKVHMPINDLIRLLSELLDCFKINNWCKRVRG
jgi:hypothetical protein